MFFEGAPRLLASGVTIPHLKAGDPERIAVETYPGILARTVIDRRSYKNDTRKKQTTEQHDARIMLLQRLLAEAPKLYGFAIEAPASLCDDPGADHLDALLCAVQAAWAWQQRESGNGAPEGLDPLGMQNTSNVTLRIRYYGLHAWLSAVYARQIGHPTPKPGRAF